MTSLKPQVDDHLNNELSEALADYSTAVYGASIATINTLTDDLESRLLNIINQEKAKLVDRISKEVVGFKPPELSKNTVYTDREDGYVTGQISVWHWQAQALNRIKQEEGLK